ncbi:MAG: helix-turn-helix domain-containing protein, partial [Christensenellaceae bacterium]
MSRLGVRPSDIAKKTGIDKTLISRWKNGRRRLSPGSPNAKKIAAYLLLRNKAEVIIRTTLSGYGLDDTTGTLSENFMFWLSEQNRPELSIKKQKRDISSSEYTASFSVFLGVNGLRSAFINVLDYVSSLPGEHNILIAIRGNQKWITSDTAFWDTFINHVGKAVEHGNTLT